MTASKAIKLLREKSSPERAIQQRKFFKTGKGEYGEGDKFIGVCVPDIRLIAKELKDVELIELEKLLRSDINEERLLALLISVQSFKKDKNNRKDIYDFYIRNRKYINNWNLVDASVEHVIGGYLFDKDKEILYKFANSTDLWERRIAIVSTFHFIRKNKFEDTLKIAEILMYDNHDLIHKATGWMLREVGKRDVETLEKFLDRYARKMPRTMLRYSIEKFSDEKRKYYMSLKN